MSEKKAIVKYLDRYLTDSSIDAIKFKMAATTVKFSCAATSFMANSHSSSGLYNVYSGVNDIPVNNNTNITSTTYNFNASIYLVDYSTISATAIGSVQLLIQIGLLFCLQLPVLV